METRWNTNEIQQVKQKFPFKISLKKKKENEIQKLIFLFIPAKC